MQQPGEGTLAWDAQETRLALLERRWERVTGACCLLAGVILEILSWEALPPSVSKDPWVWLFALLPVPLIPLSALHDRDIAPRVRPTP